MTFSTITYSWISVMSLARYRTDSGRACGSSQWLRQLTPARDYRQAHTNSSRTSGPLPSTELSRDARSNSRSD